MPNRRSHLTLIWGPKASGKTLIGNILAGENSGSGLSTVRLWEPSEDEVLDAMNWLTTDSVIVESCEPTCILGLLPDRVIAISGSQPQVGGVVVR